MSEIKQLGDVQLDNRNANKGRPRGQKQIVGSIQRNGFGRSGLLDKNGRAIAGNKTTEAAVEVFGVESEPIIIQTDGRRPVYVQRTDLDLDDPNPNNPARRLAYEDNVSSWLSFELDPQVVMADIESGFDFEAIDVSLEELGEMLEGSVKELLGGGDSPKDIAPQVDKADQLRQKYGVELGQVWQLGEHRIVCGDCTDPAVVESVMRGERADMVFTDPPYNVDIAGGTHDPRDTKNYRGGLKIENDAMSDSEFDSFLLRCFQVLNSMILRSGGVYYVCAPPGRTETQFRNAIDTVLTLRQCIVWVKQQFVFGRQDYHWRHESVLYGWKDGAAHYFSDDKTQDTVWEIDRPMRSEKEHPTQKPIELPVKAIGNSSKLNWIVFDGFLGSGSTLMACENLKRKCRGIEVDPGYVGVTLERWSQLTTRDPIRLSE